MIYHAALHRAISRYIKRIKLILTSKRFTILSDVLLSDLTPVCFKNIHSVRKKLEKYLINYSEHYIFISQECYFMPECPLNLPVMQREFRDSCILVNTTG
jgi:hypothetical protein